MSREQEDVMRCPVEIGSPEILLEYSARKLAPEAVSVLERHVTLCAACARFAKDQRAVWSALDEWEAADPTPNFDRRLYARIEADAARPWWSRLFQYGFGWKPAVAGAMATVAIAAVLLIPNYPWIERPSQVRQESLEPDQVERALDDLEMLRQLSPPNTAAAESGQAL